MVNIGPVYVWDIVFFSIIIFGGLIGFALGMMGSIYFLIGMIISFALMFALEGSLVGTWNGVGRKLFASLLKFKDQKLETAVSGFVSKNVGVLFYRSVWIASTIFFLIALYFIIVRRLLKLFKIKGWVTRCIGFVINAIPWTFMACFLIMFTSINFLYTSNSNSQKINKIKDDSVAYKIGKKIFPQLKLISNINTLYIWYDKFNKLSEDIMKDFKETLLDQEKFKENITDIIEMAKENPEVGDNLIDTVKNTIHNKPIEENKKVDINKLVEDFKKDGDKYYENAKNNPDSKTQLEELGVKFDDTPEDKEKLNSLIKNLESIKSQTKGNEKLTDGFKNILGDSFKGLTNFFQSKNNNSSRWRF